MTPALIALISALSALVLLVLLVGNAERDVFGPVRLRVLARHAHRHRIDVVSAHEGRAEFFGDDREDPASRPDVKHRYSEKRR